MTRRKGISPNTARKWLEECENGKKPTQIALEERSDIRTIKRHIAMARTAREAIQGRRDFMLKRIEQHQEDLLAEVDRLRKLLVRHAPIGLAPDDPLQEKLFEALKAHGQGLPIKKLFEDWDKTLATYSEHKEAIRTQLETEERKLISVLPKEVDFYPWTRAILEVLESGLSFEETGRQYEKKSAGENYRVSWGDAILTRSTVTEAQEAIIVKAHKKLVTFAKKYTPEFQKHAQQFSELSGLLIDELVGFKIKRMVNGRCRYCPA